MLVTAVIKSDIRSRPARWGAAFVVLLLMADVLSIVTWMTFPALKIQKISASTSASAETASPEILQLMDKLQASGANPFLVGGAKTRRPPFSVPGILMTLRGDNIQIFEYPNQATSAGEAASFVNSRSQAHLYVEGSLLVLYTGNRDEIISVLTGALGAPRT